MSNPCNLMDYNKPVSCVLHYLLRFAGNSCPLSHCVMNLITWSFKGCPSPLPFTFPASRSFSTVEGTIAPSGIEQWLHKTKSEIDWRGKKDVERKCREISHLGTYHRFLLCFQSVALGPSVWGKLNQNFWGDVEGVQSLLLVQTLRWADAWECWRIDVLALQAWQGHVFLQGSCTPKLGVTLRDWQGHHKLWGLENRWWQGTKLALEEIKSMARRLPR